MRRILFRADDGWRRPVSPSAMLALVTRRHEIHGESLGFDREAVKLGGIGPMVLRCYFV